MLRPSPPLFPPAAALRSAMSKAAVKISSDLLSNPLCEQDAAFLGVVTAFDTAMRRMDSFNQEKVGAALAEGGRWGRPLRPHIRGSSSPASHNVAPVVPGPSAHPKAVGLVSCW